MDDARKLAQMLEGQQRLKFMQQMGMQAQQMSPMEQMIQQNMGAMTQLDQMGAQQAIGGMAQGNPNMMTSQMGRESSAGMGQMTPDQMQAAQPMVRQPQANPNMPMQRGISANMPIKKPMY